MGRLNFVSTPIAGLWEVQTQPRGDERGRLTRLYCADAFAQVRPGLRFVQLNHTRTAQRGTVRGLHFQRAPALEAKLVGCLQGRVHDVVVDVRPGSPTFGQWHAVELDGERQNLLLVPEGCAHGFQALSHDVQMLYQHSAAYAPEHEGGLRHDDPRLAIHWPLPVTLVSDRDRSHALIDTSFTGVPV